ncbi:MAG TPA: HAD-IC family P-type ATPase, partial [Acidimicrobiales bacterium]|nr:HAD-IC family P-type ATPase [Acidimicrobiales bacterium]
MTEPTERTGEVMATGLSDEEVAARLADGRANRAEADTSQTWGRILRRNALTRLNFLLLVLGAATLATGALPDATFLAVAVINTVVGAVEESRAKRQLDRLAVVSAPRARAVRAGAIVDLAVEDLVLDDLLELRPGDQLAVDVVVLEGSAEVDESLTTGESEPVAKGVGDDLLSGTWVVAGVVRARVTRVGRDSYANRLAAEARRFSLAGSELVAAVNRVLRWVTWAMVVIGPVLFWRQVQHEPWRVAVRLSVAGIVGMIPEGLVLLTTLAFLASAVRLSRLRTLVQELPAIETLARVDALCVDKTG